MKTNTVYIRKCLFVFLWSAHHEDCFKRYCCSKRSDSYHIEIECSRDYYLRPSRFTINITHRRIGSKHAVFAVNWFFLLRVKFLTVLIIILLFFFWAIMKTCLSNIKQSLCVSLSLACLPNLFSSCAKMKNFYFDEKRKQQSAYSIWCAIKSHLANFCNHNLAKCVN